jgi:hypothetical protein
VSRWGSERPSIRLVPATCALRQNEHELQAAGHTRLAKNLQRLSFEWVMRTRDSHAFGKVLMMGSVSWCPSTKSRKIC